MQEYYNNTTAEKGFKFKVGKQKVVRGFDSGIVGMKKGGRRLIAVAAAAGYGATGASGIPANRCCSCSCTCSRFYCLVVCQCVCVCVCACVCV